MKPVGQVFDLAAMPANLDDPDAAAFRIWDNMRTQVCVKFAQNVPDGVLQMSLQSWFLSLVMPGLDTGGKCMMVMNILFACIGVVADSCDLIIKNRRITVITG